MSGTEIGLVLFLVTVAWGLLWVEERRRIKDLKKDLQAEERKKGTKE